MRAKLLTTTCAALCLLALSSAPAQAQSVSGNYSGLTRINKGVFDLGFDGLLLSRNLTQPILVNGEEAGEVATSTLSLTIGPELRYFVIDNLSVGVRASFFLENAGTTTTPDEGDATEISSSDTGGIFFLNANYYLRLGSSFFLTPGVGVGGFVGNRSIPDPLDDAKIIQSGLGGIAARGHLGCAFYANQHWNLRAGVDLVYRAGSVTPQAEEGDAEPDAQSFTTLDAAFTIGMGYSF
jgi:hypothetical protein